MQSDRSRAASGVNFEVVIPNRKHSACKDDTYLIVMSGRSRISTSGRGPSITRALMDS